MVIEKSRERVPIWKSFSSRESAIPTLFTRVINLPQERELTVVEKTLLVQFFINAFEGMEHAAVRQVRHDTRSMGLAPRQAGSHSHVPVVPRGTAAASLYIDPRR